MKHILLWYWRRKKMVYLYQRGWLWALHINPDSLLWYSIEPLISWTLRWQFWDCWISTIQLINCSMGYHDRLSEFICRAKINHLVTRRTRPTTRVLPVISPNFATYVGLESADWWWNFDFTIHLVLYLGECILSNIIHVICVARQDIMLQLFSFWM